VQLWPKSLWQSYNSKEILIWVFQILFLLLSKQISVVLDLVQVHENITVRTGDRAVMIKVSE